MKKVIMVIRDGRGRRESCEQNAICEAALPITDELMKKYPHTLLKTCGEDVGLPEGYQGNSEVGHLTIGSGRILSQSLVRINKSIASGEFYQIPAFMNAIKNCKKNNSTLHLIGLIQSEGVHAHEDHLYALLELCKRNDFQHVSIHVITDGRDAPVKESLEHLKKLENKLQELGFGQVATISGRFYTMDRDNKWERTKKAYDCIADGIIGSDPKIQTEMEFDKASDMLQICYENEETDEFVVPRKLRGYQGIKDNDSVIFFNFRTDRTRQLTKALLEQPFEGFERNKKNIYFVAMTDFYENMPGEVAFKDISLANLLGEVISKKGYRQLRISETEKYAHVTFFFNGQIESPNLNEERMMVDSPKVETYDLKPEMSVFELTNKLVEQIEKNKYDFIVTNLVNGDMVGHTGKTDAIVKAVESVDECLGRIVKAGLQNEYVILVLADHGNAEDQTEQRRTSHTMNKVPCIVVSNDSTITLKDDKGLQDIAPTVLKIMGIEKPQEMTGESIIQ